MNIQELNQKLFTKMRSGVQVQYGNMYALLQMIFSQVQPDYLKRHQQAITVLDIINTTKDEKVAVQKTWDVISNLKSAINDSLIAREKHFADIVRPHLKGKRILDFGCGNGGIAMNLNPNQNWTLMDVKDYRRQEAKSLPFVNDFGHLNGKFDCALSLMVFHHCVDPLGELARLATKADYLIVIESVRSKIMSYECQALIDWFYNRPLQPDADVPVPGHFHEDGYWVKNIENLGFNLIHKQDLGIDILIVPEHHFLLVFEK